MARHKPTDALRILNTDYRAPEVLPVKYQRLFNKIASAEIPAHRDEGGSRWLIDEADLPAISIALGLTPAAPAVSEQVLPKPVAELPKHQADLSAIAKSRPLAIQPTATAPAVAVKLGRGSAVKDEIGMTPPSPCGPAATPVGTAPPKRRRRSAVTPEKTSPGKSTRSSSRRAA
jgi:hypothetical protein